MTILLNPFCIVPKFIHCAFGQGLSIYNDVKVKNNTRKCYDQPLFLIILYMDRTIPSNGILYPFHHRQSIITILLSFNFLYLRYLKNYQITIFSTHLIWVMEMAIYIYNFTLKENRWMGLDYLNKKVWHPGSMKNIQKVWQVEQQQRQINKKSRERAKKLLEEQHNDELKRIQVEAGLIPRSHLDRMEWMYDWGNKIQQQKTNEEYLTGQKQATPGDKNFKHVFQEEITNRRCEDFQLLHEDPMFQIMKKEKAYRDSITGNPIQMRNIIKEVEKEYLPQDLEQRRKKHYSKRRRTSSSSSRSQRSRSSTQRHKKTKKSKRSKESRSRSRERGEKSRKYEEESKSQKKSFKQSSIYQKYLQQRFGGIIKKDEDGNLKPDYSIHKSKYRTQIQIDEDERRRRLQKLRENARKLEELKGSEKREERELQSEKQYEEGAANIRKNMMYRVKQNRNHKSHRNSDSD